MSFSLEWPCFSDQFHTDAIQMLNNALNKGNKPPVIAGKIEVVELEMGTEPPELEIRDIGDLTTDQFRGIFRFTYAGDAHIVLKTKVQANPLNNKHPDIHLMSGSRGMLAAKQPLVVPMLLRLSHFKLNSYVVLVVSKQKGITLVFKTDPLQNVDINSSFDSIAVIQKFIQKEIEGQLRQMFREDLPGIIHRLSQQWVKAKVEAPYLNKHPPPPMRRKTFDAMSAPDLSIPVSSSVGLHTHMLRQQSLGPLSYGRAPFSSTRSISGASNMSRRLRTKSTPPTSPSPESSPSSFPDLENFDPTYGLRPEGLPVKSVFASFGQLFAPNKGLADLAEEPNEGDGVEYEYEYDESASFDVVDWEDTVPDFTPPPTVSSNGTSPEYQTLPAVGGGTITRPRIYHSQSLIQSEALGSTTQPGIPKVSQSFDPTHSAGLTRAALSSIDAMNNHPLPLIRPRSMFDIPSSPLDRPNRAIVPDSMATTQFSRSGSGICSDLTSLPLHRNHTDHDDLDEDNESQGIYMKRPRSDSIPVPLSPSTTNFDTFPSSSPPNPNDIPEPNPKIVLRPSLNNSIHQLSTLSHSNHTLSPYTRSLEHFTVRSVPPRDPGLSPVTERQPVKARRRRTHRLGAKIVAGTTMTPITFPSPGLDPVPPSEFDASDMDRYFRNDFNTHNVSTAAHPTHVWRRRPPSDRPLASS